MEDFSRYNGEGTVLRSVQLRMLELLRELDRICRENGIRYWIAYGTLLGAVRHKGFVPWDDDLDVFIHEDDFEKFCLVCEKSLPQWVFLQTGKTDPDSNLYRDFVRLRDNQSLIIQKHDSFMSKYNKGIFIDVFKAKTFPNAPKCVLKYLLKRISYAYGFLHNPRQVNMKNIVSYFLYPLSYYFHKLILFVICALGDKSCYGASGEVSVYGSVYPKEETFPLKEIEFENYRFYAPNDADSFLKRVYGNYWEIPPKNRRKACALYAVIDIKKCVVLQEETSFPS